MLMFSNTNDIITFGRTKEITSDTVPVELTKEKIYKNII